MVNEFKERERHGEVVPVAIPPNVRLQLEEEREEIISKLHVRALRVRGCTGPC